VNFSISLSAFLNRFLSKVFLSDLIEAKNFLSTTYSGIKVLLYFLSQLRISLDLQVLQGRPALLAMETL